jgi:hypothetical protein
LNEAILEDAGAESLQHRRIDFHLFEFSIFS